jgi:hypothetical protein
VGSLTTKLLHLSVFPQLLFLRFFPHSSFFLCDVFPNLFFSYWSQYPFWVFFFYFHVENLWDFLFTRSCNVFMPSYLLFVNLPSMVVFIFKLSLIFPFLILSILFFLLYSLKVSSHLTICSIYFWERDTLIIFVTLFQPPIKFVTQGQVKTFFNTRRVGLHIFLQIVSSLSNTVCILQMKYKGSSVSFSVLKIRIWVTCSLYITSNIAQICHVISYHISYLGVIYLFFGSSGLYCVI